MQVAAAAIVQLAAGGRWSSSTGVDGDRCGAARSRVRHATSVMDCGSPMQLRSTRSSRARRPHQHGARRRNRRRPRSGGRAHGHRRGDRAVGAGGRQFETVAGSSTSAWSVNPTAPTSRWCRSSRHRLHPGGRQHRDLGVGALLNVNADTLAAHLAAPLGADRFIVAGATAGVLDGQGALIAALSLDGIDGMTSSGTAHSGMVAKLTACRHALVGGVRDIAIVSGRGVVDLTARPRIEPADSSAGTGMGRT